MTHWIKSTSFAVAIGAMALVAAAPQAEAQRWRRGSVAAGVAAGVVGGVIVGSLAARPYGAGAYGYDYDYEPGYYRSRGAPYGGVYGYAPGYAYAPRYVEPGYAYGPGYDVPRRQYYRRPDTGLRSGVVRVSPHYDY